MSEPLRFFKEPTLPGVLQPHSFYAIEVPGAGNENFAEFYVTDAAGVAHGIGTAAWINSLTGNDIRVQSGAVVGTNLVLTMSDASLVTIDASAFVADIKLQSGAYNAATQAIDFTMSDGSIISVPSAALLPVATGPSVDGDGSTMPLAVNPSTDANNAVIIGTDGKLWVDAATFHTHANKPQLDKISEDVNGCLLYDGDLPDYWTTANW